MPQCPQNEAIDKANKKEKERQKQIEEGRKAQEKKDKKAKKEATKQEKKTIKLLIVEIIKNCNLLLKKSKRELHPLFLLNQFISIL